MGLFPQFTEGRVKARLTSNKKIQHLGDFEGHPPAENERSNTDFNFQIAPELGSFLATHHNYLTTFRHENCPEHGTCNPSFSNDCLGSDFVEIIPQSAALHERFSRWMEVCPGGCNEVAEGRLGDSGSTDDAISGMLYEHTREICDILHPEKDHVIEIVDTRILWSDKSPIPAYFSPGRGNIVAHSSEVTAGHLALIQARGQVDDIQLDFRTY
ncbi:hypothetical protein F5Y03DRAFT_395660 [Xylaria venustula]|nr:hypothetical protein F5Y03DRAFT_395660 [Xylaria venustula]